MVDSSVINTIGTIKSFTRSNIRKHAIENQIRRTLQQKTLFHSLPRKRNHCPTLIYFYYSSNCFIFMLHSIHFQTNNV